jgi:hypothetical protein
VKEKQEETTHQQSLFPPLETKKNTIKIALSTSGNRNKKKLSNDQSFYQLHRRRTQTSNSQAVPSAKEQEEIINNESLL